MADEQKALKVYIAGPYGPQNCSLHDAVQQAHQNTLLAIEAGIELAKKGHIPFIPHLMHFFHMQTKEPFPSDYYNHYDMAWLPLCDALVLLKSSPGADKEAEWARANGKDVYASVAAVPAVSEVKPPLPDAPAASPQPVPQLDPPPKLSHVEDAREASKDALKAIYGIIVGLAITQGLRQAFFPNNVSLGYEVLLPQNFRSIILLFALIPTIVRFAHGAFINLGVTSQNRYRPIADFGTFLLQGVLFFLMALSLSDVTSFLFFFTVLLVADAAWLLILWRIGYIQLDGNGKFPKKTFQQWVVSDALLAATSGILFWLDLTRPGFDVFLSAVVITVAAIVAAALDYVLCKEYYFPPVPSTAPSAGP